MLKSTPNNNKKSTLKSSTTSTSTKSSKIKTKSPLLTTQKRTKTWKKHQNKVIQGIPKGKQTTLPGQLTPLLWDRVLLRDQLVSFNQIKPKIEYRTLPTKENNYFIEELRPIPHDLHHRILSYIDQFDTPIRPKQIVKHFVEHPTSPIYKNHVYTVMEKLAKAHNIRKLRKIDEEGTEHWFFMTTPQSRIRHNNRLKVLIKQKKQLPLDEVIWETFENQLDSYSNLREMTPEQRIIFDKQQKEQKLANLAAMKAKI